MLVKVILRKNKTSAHSFELLVVLILRFIF